MAKLNACIVCICRGCVYEQRRLPSLGGSHGTPQVVCLHVAARTAFHFPARRGLAGTAATSSPAKYRYSIFGSWDKWTSQTAEDTAKIEKSRTTQPFGHTVAFLQVARKLHATGWHAGRHAAPLGGVVRAVSVAGQRAWACRCKGSPTRGTLRCALAVIARDKKAGLRMGLSGISFADVGILRHSWETRDSDHHPSMFHVCNALPPHP